ncbi:MAG: Flp family type IVb pilin [Bryobacterales bacterium]|nr:Flp family type IVb pilin [Bryobacterales bacterium]
MNWIMKLWRDEQGQDLVEYTLLLAFVALVSAGLLTTIGQSVSGIWTSADTTVKAASTAALP